MNEHKKLEMMLIRQTGTRRRDEEENNLRNMFKRGNTIWFFALLIIHKTPFSFSISFQLSTKATVMGLGQRHNTTPTSLEN